MASEAFLGHLIGIFQILGGGVINTIENKFEHFLDKKDLEEISGSKTFRDLKYGFVFNHEIKRSLDEDYEFIKNKYNRRVDLFLKKIKEKTCFIRAVRNQGELIYIAENYEYINSVIKQDNCDNKIIYLTLSTFKIPIELQNMNDIYRLNIDQYNGSKEELDKLFDSIPEFLLWCREHSEEQMREHNLDFFKGHNIERVSTY